MKVLFISHGDPDIDFSGVPLIAKQYIINLRKIGHECALLLPKINDKEINFENNIYDIAKFYWPSISNWGLKAFEKKPNQFNVSTSQIDFIPDIVHILNWVNFSPSVLVKLKSFNVPIVRHMYNFEDFCYFTRPIYFHKDHEACRAPLSPENCSTCITKNQNKKTSDKIKSIIFNKKKKLRKSLENRDYVIKEHFINYSDHLIFPCRSFAEFFFEHYRGSKPYSIVNHGIEKPKNKIKENSNDDINIIFCGGTELAKGWFVIENVFKKILMDGSKNFKLRIYGDKKITSKSSLSAYKNVSFFERYAPGEIDKIFGWADIAIAPFFFETYSRIVREFMIRGVIPISTDAFGIPDIIEDNVNGFIIKKPMETDLYKILNTILSNRKILENMKKKVKNTVITTPEDELNNILKIYKKLTNSQKYIK